jgi:transcriptional regulator with XRE-family HTH domain
MSTPVQRPATIDVAGLMRQIIRCMELDGISASELARRTDMSPGYVSMILSGKREQTLAKALLLAHAVGLAQLTETVR